MEKEATSLATSPFDQLRARRKIGIAEAAEILNQKPATLFNWAKEGKIGYIQYGPHGRILFFEDEVLKFLEDNIHHPRVDDSQHSLK